MLLVPEGHQSLVRVGVVLQVLWQVRSVRVVVAAALLALREPWWAQVALASAPLVRVAVVVLALWDRLARERE